MYLKLVTPPTELPLTLEDAKAYLRVDGTYDDALISALISAATEHVQNVTNRQLMPATFQLSLDRLPSSFSLPRPPFADITSITAIDDAGQVVEFEDTFYTTEDREETLIQGILDSGWYASTYSGIKITYTAGYESREDIPGTIIQALKALVIFFYENRGEANKPIPEFIYNLLGSHRIFSF